MILLANGVAWGQGNLILDFKGKDPVDRQHNQETFL